MHASINTLTRVQILGRIGHMSPNQDVLSDSGDPNVWITRQRIEVGKSVQNPLAALPHALFKKVLDLLDRGSIISLSNTCHWARKAVRDHPFDLTDIPSMTVQELRQMFPGKTSSLTFSGLRLKTVTLTALMELRGWLGGRISHVNALFLRSCNTLKNLSPLQGFSNLRELTIHGCNNLALINTLSKLTKLEMLILSDCGRLKDLKPLGSLPILRVLALSGCNELEDLTPLKHLVKLEMLEISRCPKLQNLLHLSYLTKLHSLNLSQCASIVDLTPLENLKRLTTLNLGGCSQLVSVSVLLKLPNLRELDMFGCNRVLVDARVLKRLQQLSKFYR